MNSGRFYDFFQRVLVDCASIATLARFSINFVDVVVAIG